MYYVLDLPGFVRIIEAAKVLAFIGLLSVYDLHNIK